MHRIPSELPSEACLGESSTRMGDLLESPRVAPLLLLFPVAMKIRMPNKFTHERNTIDGCDHTSTNAPDPIRTPQLSVLGRE